MFEASQKREFEILVFLSFDEISGKGFQSTIQYLQIQELLDVGWRGVLTG